MRALLVAVGTRGDVQPALALALALRDLGHSAQLCVSPGFVAWAKDLGLEAIPMGVEMRMPAKASGPAPKLTPEQLRQLRASMPDLVTDQFKTIGAAVRDCDVIVGANAHQYAAPSIAQHRGIPCVTAVYAPVAIPSVDLAPPPAPGQQGDAGQNGNADTERSIAERWRATAAEWNERALERMNANRAELGLAAITDVLDYVLTDHTWLAADAPLAPLPTTPGRDVFETGAWVFPDERPLPDALEEFLQSGDPPIFIGFGSMPASGDVGRALVDAALANGQRVLLSQGWAELSLPEDARDCFLVGDVNHGRLFPRTAAVVHHGGAGTTAAAARAGVPQLVMPMFSDQFYWARRVVELGIGATASHANVGKDSLAASLNGILTSTVADAASSFAKRMRSDGAQVAAKRLVADYGS